MPNIAKGHRTGRQCKWCSSQVKELVDSVGRFKGYLRTCGKVSCLNAASKDANVRMSKRFQEQRVCQSCKEDYIAVCNTQKWCKMCSPDRRASAILQRYGVSKPQWNEMYEKQEGKCVLCDKEPKAVDHDHSTGRTRDLLCHGCNTAIAVLERDRDWITRALNYIQSHAV
jgi:hypothetical protein